MRRTYERSHPAVLAVALREGEKETGQAANRHRAMTVSVNGAAEHLDPAPTVAEFLAARNLLRSGVAIAINYSIIPRGAFDRHRLVDNDVIEIVEATSGG
jgi:sulfur carrier protein